MLTKNEKVKKSREHRPAESKRSKNGTKKTSVFRIFINLTTHAHIFWKMRKKALMLVFFGPFSRFFHFLKSEKIGKNRKNVQKIAFFPLFSYALRLFFYASRVTQNAHKLLKRRVIKKTKKTWKNIFKTFFKNQNLDNYFCPFFKF